jgi:thiol:disulfide interchange protein
MLILAAAAVISSAAEEPFSVSGRIVAMETGDPVLLLSFTVQEGNYLYADQTSISVDGIADLSCRQFPSATKHNDPVSGEEVDVYAGDFTFTCRLSEREGPFRVTVAYRGCNDSLCFPPVTRTFVLDPLDPGRGEKQSSIPEQRVSVAASSIWKAQLARFNVTGKAVGYMKSEPFIEFLKEAESGQGLKRDVIQGIMEKHGLWLAAVAIVVFGLGLNLTPCVLPMIPINIAIIGAGARAGSRVRGFALGGVYGLGIALVYGLLGIGVIRTGSQFGTLNSSPSFNIAVAVIFLMMALAMFGVFNLDFSRYQGRMDAKKSRQGSFITAFVVGCIAALLAGACVAPVVVSVLLLSADLYARGRPLAMVLPFLLGAGMALPWPFAGAGLSLFPRPGKWMEKVKYAFGAIILVMAIRYGMLGYSLFEERSTRSRAEVASALQEKTKEGWIASLPEALALAEQEKRPVFVDFWASWCKNCLKMEKKTFQDPLVRQRLEFYVKLSYRADDPTDPAIEAVLDRFEVIGFPTYIVLMPDSASPETDTQ